MSPRRAQPPRLSPKESLIVELLIRDTELYGLQMVAGSRGRLKRGTVYVTLGRMEDKGFITSREVAPPADEGGLPRRCIARRRSGATCTKRGTWLRPTWH